jgi:hypothetical protein
MQSRGTGRVRRPHSRTAPTPSALTTAAAALRDGHGIDEAVLRAKARAAFAGTIRTNLMRMLDGVGLHHALDLPSSAALFHYRRELATSTSGGTPPVTRRPVLAAFARQVLAANLAWHRTRLSYR